MSQPPSGGQHPGGGGGGDEGDGESDGGDGSGSHGGGDGGDGSRSVGGGEGGDDSRSAGKGSGGKRRAFRSRESRETDSHCVGSRDSDMRYEAPLKSYQVRVDLHLFARILFPDVEESPSHRTQPTSSVHNTLLLRLLEEGERLQHMATSPERQHHSLAETASSFCLEVGMPALRRSESATVSSLSSGERRKLRIDSELLTSPCGPSSSSARRKVQIDSELLTSPCRPSASSAPHATIPRGQENVRSNPPHLQLGTISPCSPPFSYVETQDWQSCKVLEGPAAGVLETGGSEYERHASEGVSVDFETKSTATPGEEELSPGAHAVQREEESQHWQSHRVLETGASEYERHASEVATVDSESKSTAAPGEEELSQREEETQHWPAREVLKGLDARVLETGASEHERQASEGASVDSESKSTTTPGIEELSQEAHALQQEEETQHWPAREVLKGVDAGVLKIGASEHERQASEGASVDSESKSTTTPGQEELSQEAHALQREEGTQHWSARKVLKGLDAGVRVIGTSEEVLHSRSVVATTQEGDVKGGQWTFVEGNDRGEEGRTWTFVEARLLGDEEGEEEPLVETRVHGDEKGEEPVVEGGEVAVDIQMDPEQKDHDSSSTRCGEE
ncbi:hypothetical protein CBR_g44934 [Chara braunii]|uniref:Uncharacterized protein n=1 Tax=Chara braunii TaxID=69332 RepID=A0A388LXZ6_CHABU|nr:hypothetical protein CBR_g44934 [Chara braunii]|eukprot:GBG87198.1 hypothetical protein CBR_g44934 [Chara braunii]